MLKAGESPGFDGGFNLTHQLEEEVQVVQGEQTQAEDLLFPNQVSKVGDTKLAAGGAGATILDGRI